MKILHVAESIRGGCGTYLNELVPRQIAELGTTNVCVLVPDRHVSQIPDVPATSTCSFRRPGRATGLLFLAARLRQLVRELRPDVIHAHSTFAGAIARGLVMAGMRLPPIVYCPHGWVFDTARSPMALRWLRAIERTLSRRCVAVIAISNAEAGAAHAAGIRRERVVVIENGIRSYPPTTEVAAWDGARLKVLFVGRLDRQKGLDILLSAVRPLQHTVSVRVAGEAVLGSRATPDWPGNVEYLGWLGHAEVTAQMAACDVVVMPSRWEGFGLVAIEAMRLAKPVVASGVGGLREIIVEGVTGRLVPAEDPVALREALLADSAQRRAQMGCDGRRRFLERYCIDRTHAQLLRLYARAFRDQTSNRGARAPRDVFINGRFLAQRVGGVQRFAWEVIKALDQELSDDPSASLRNWTLVVPRTAPPGIALKRIAVKVIGRGRPGHFWDQFVLPRVARQGVVVNLTNGAPLLHPRCLVVIHDAAVFRTPENFAPVYVFLHRALGRLLSLKSSLGTVSEFSRSELAQILRIDRSRIFVVPNSCEHLGRVPPDDTVLGRLGLERNRYFLFVGKPSPNKNLTAAIAAFARLGVPGYRFVIVGMADPTVFRAGFDAIAPDILVAGHLSDPELVGLLQGATALLFPSLYEGFGIPPLEGMVTGCPVVASRIPAVLEVCGDAALYFDPKDVELITRKMRAIVMNPALRAMLIEKGKERASRFSWQFSARCLLDAIATVK